MRFQVFHKYRELADSGLVEPLACTFCANPFTLRVSEEDEPVFYCAFCNLREYPTIDLYARIEKDVKELY